MLQKSWSVTRDRNWTSFSLSCGSTHPSSPSGWFIETVPLLVRKR